MQPRPLWRFILIAAVCLLLPWAGNAFIGRDVDPRIADPVSIRVAGIRDTRIASGRWLSELSFTMSSQGLNRMGGIDVFIGGRRFAFSRQEFLSKWRIEQVAADGGSTCRATAPPEVAAGRSLLPWVPPYINWPGDWPAFLRSMPRRLAILIGAIVAAMLLVRIGRKRGAESMLARCMIAPEGPPAGPRHAGKDWRWLLAGGGVLAAAIVIVESIQPMYFSQGDVTTTELPHMLQGCRGVFAGVFPEWNACQLLGEPTTASGYLSLLYPPTYLAYLLAWRVLGNENVTMEVFTILHLLAGYLVTYWVARKLGVRPAIAAVASLSVVLSGYSLIGGRSWHAVAPILVWMPLMIASLIHLERGPVGWKWALLTAAAMAMFFYVGFTQFWGFAMMFWLVAAVVLVLTRRAPPRRAMWAAPAMLIAIGLSSPLLLAQQRLAADVEPEVIRTNGIEVGLAGMVAPYPLSSAPHPNGWGNVGVQYMTEIYYSGTLFCVVTFAAFGALMAYRWSRRLIGQNVWLVCAAIAMLLALGKSGLLWPLITELPMVSKMRNNPFRMLVFFNLFAALGGAVIVERWLAQLRRPRAWAAGLALTVSALLLYHSFLARPSFCSFGDAPYPKLPGEMSMLDSTRTDRPQRIIPFGWQWTEAKGLALSMIHSFPTAYSILSFDGYNPVIETKPRYRECIKRLWRDPVAAARAYGVKWILLSRVPTPQAALANARPELAPALKALYEASRQVAVLPEVEVRELDAPSPLAFDPAQPQQALPIRFNAAGADVDVSGAKGGSVVVNVLYWPEMVARADGREIAAGPDQWGRTVVSLAAPALALELRYRTPWMIGILAGAIMILAGAAIGAGLSSCRRWLD